MTVTIAPFPSVTKSRETIEAMIREIGREVTFYVIATISGCSLCSLDPITNTATDSFCPSCAGEYWIPVYSGVTYSGKVSWGLSEQKDWVTAGLIDTGDCQVTIMHTADAERVVHSSEYVIVDNREMDVKNIILRGVPQINRILIALKEKERE